MSREFHPADTVIQVLDRKVGGGHFALIAGPCSVETADQLLEAARVAKAAGATMLRGGAFKPRTSPYAFQGLGLEGLQLLAAAREETGLPVVTELMDPRDLEAVVEYADVIQIGARNMQNFQLLAEVGRAGKPVLLKRAPSATVEELLMAAEYILSNGNYNVMLCERGIRTFETSTRNTLDINAVPVLKKLSHLPVIVDPSHATGKSEYVIATSRAAIAAEYIVKEGNRDVILCERGIRTFETATRNTLDISAVPVIKIASHLPIIVDPSHSAGRLDLVLPLSLAAVAAGADGVIVETHPNPEHALCDGPQSLPSAAFAEYVGRIRDLAAFTGKTLS